MQRWNQTENRKHEATDEEIISAADQKSQCPHVRSEPPAPFPEVGIVRLDKKSLGGVQTVERRHRHARFPDVMTQNERFGLVLPWGRVIQSVEKQERTQADEENVEKILRSAHNDIPAVTTTTIWQTLPLMALD